MFYGKEWYQSQYVLAIGLALLLGVLSQYSYADVLIKANEESRAPTVIELYTSQGCYSCPPADALLGELAKKDDVIALSCHVTYWNYLGWKDTFSRSFCDNRQRQYQRALVGGSRGVYTPQMIINGRYGGVGSRWQTIRGLLKADQQRQPALLPIGLTQQPQQLSIDLPQIPVDSSKLFGHRQIQLFLLGTTGEHLLPINRGENSGKQLPYFNPVEYVKDLGQWNGQLKNIQERLPDDPRIKEWVVLAQASPIGGVVAAGKLSVTHN